MARWKLGEAEIERLLAAGELQRLTGEAANGERLLEKAATTLETARTAILRDPDSAFVLAYDAARQALTALLAHQGLRPTTKGGHYAVEQAVVADGQDRGRVVGVWGWARARVVSDAAAFGVVSGLCSCGCSCRGSAEGALRSGTWTPGAPSSKG